MPYVLPNKLHYIHAFVASNMACFIPMGGRYSCLRAYSYVFTAAKLIAPVMDKKDWEAGYDWVVETIKLDHEYLASKMEIEKALHYLKTKEFDKVFRRVV